MRSNIVEMRLDMVDKRINIGDAKMDSIDKRLNTAKLNYDYTVRKRELSLGLRSLLQEIDSDLRSTK
jgi:hypothetical protein